MSSTDRNNTSVDIFSYNLVFIETGLESKCLAQIGIIQVLTYSHTIWCLLRLVLSRSV